MTSSVSPLPVPIWPMLGLSLILIAVTSAAVTFSSRHAAHVYHAQGQSVPEIEAPAFYHEMKRAHKIR